MKKVLFVCTGNTCRSPMAEAVFNSLCQDRGLPYVAESAGVCTLTGLPMSENSAECLREQGIDPSYFTSTSVEDVDMESMVHFFVMSDDHMSVLMSAFGVESDKITVMNISDPYGSSLQRYRLCLDEIRAEVEAIVKDLGDSDADKKADN